MAPRLSVLPVLVLKDGVFSRADMSNFTAVVNFRHHLGLSLKDGPGVNMR